MVLTEWQAKNLDAVKWLITGDYSHGNRGTGRSTLMAYAFLQVAVDHQGVPIELFDHHRHYNNLRYLVRVITELMQQDEEFKHYAFEINTVNNCLVCKGLATGQ